MNKTKKRFFKNAVKIDSNRNQSINPRKSLFNSTALAGGNDDSISLKSVIMKQANSKTKKKIDQDNYNQISSDSGKILYLFVYVFYCLIKLKKLCVSFEDEVMSDSDMNSIKSEVVKNKLISKLKAEAGKTPTSSAKVKIFSFFSP